MATIAQIRTALASALGGISGVQATGYQLANPTPPTIQVGIGTSDFSRSMHGSGNTGHCERDFIVEAFVPYTTDQGSQKKLDALNDMTGANTVRGAIIADPTLGAVVDFAYVVSSTGNRVYERAGGSPVLGCEFTVRVLHS